MTRRDREDLITDLNYLRKGEGLTLERLPNAPAVIDYCGGPDVPLSTVRTRLITAVNSLRQHKGGPALRAAYGIDDDSPASTTERRRRYAASVGRKPNTVLEWENSAIEELALILITSYYAGAKTPSGLVIPHGGFLIEDLHVVTVIRDRSFFESHQTRTIISLVEGAAGFRYGSYSPTELSHLTGATADPARTTQRRDYAHPALSPNAPTWRGLHLQLPRTRPSRRTRRYPARGSRLLGTDLRNPDTSL